RLNQPRDVAGSRRGRREKLVETRPGGWVALAREIEQGLRLQGQILLHEGRNARRIGVHEQRFGGGAVLGFMNLFGLFERDFLFAVGDELPDARFRRGAQGRWWRSAFERRV